MSMYVKGRLTPLVDQLPWIFITFPIEAGYESYNHSVNACLPYWCNQLEKEMHVEFFFLFPQILFLDMRHRKL